MSAWRAVRVGDHARRATGEEEATLTVMTALQEVIERKGLFCALYSDRGSHFWLTPKAGEAVDPHRLTQVGRALRTSFRVPDNFFPLEQAHVDRPQGSKPVRRCTGPGIVRKPTSVLLSGTRNDDRNCRSASA